MTKLGTLGMIDKGAVGVLTDGYARDTDDFTAIYNVGGVAIYRVRGMTARLNHNRTALAAGGTQ